MPESNQSLHLLRRQRNQAYVVAALTLLISLASMANTFLGHRRELVNTSTELINTQKALTETQTALRQTQEVLNKLQPH